MSFIKALKNAINLIKHKNPLSKPTEKNIVNGKNSCHKFLHSLKMKNDFINHFFIKYSVKTREQTVSNQPKEPKVYYDNYLNDLCPLMQERHRKLREYAYKSHNNPKAQEFAWQLQTLIESREVTYVHNAIIQATEEIKFCAENIMKIMKGMKEQEKVKPADHSWNK
jgi:hypothetical protein